jgi:cation diffusion facilitator CzcD-associated flavoprotein CzcO
VQQVAPVGDGSYLVTVHHLETGETITYTYGAVLVANGHHWDPYWPDVPGTFEGEVMHAHAYKTADVLKDKRVLIVGAGNSACDIACEATKLATSTAISTRRGAHVIPKYLLGRPLDAFTTPFSTRMPRLLQRLTASILLYLTRGRQAKYGFPRPDYPFGAEHPTISSDLLDLVGQGKIGVRPDVERLEGDCVHFVDGTKERADLLIYGTGYNVSFPFFDADFLQPEDNRLPLYHIVVPPEQPNINFIGLLQPIGAVMPLCEMQSAWVADLLDGTIGLPTVEQMHAGIE